MLNKALLLVSGKKKGVPSFTLDLSELSAEYLRSGRMHFDGSYITLEAGEVYTVENQRLDYVDIVGTVSIDLPIGADDKFELVNAQTFSESTGNDWGYMSFYFAPDDLTKDAYVKITYP